MSSTGMEQKVPGLLNGKINFRARKLVQESSVKKIVEVASSSDCCESQTEVCNPAAETPGQIEETSCGVEDIAVAKAGPKRNSGSRKRGKATVTHSEQRRVTRSRTAVSTSRVLSEEQPATSLPVGKGNDSSSNLLLEEQRSTVVTVAEKSSVDFWHSPLSENADQVAIKGPLDLVLPRKAVLATEDVAAAIQHLKSADSRLKAVIEMHHEPKFERCSSAFTALVRSIVFQQLATKAASTIFGRVVDLCGSLDKVEPTTIAGLSKEQLRAAGLSERKASYVHDLASHFLTGKLSDVAIHEMDDEDLTKALTAVKGIGVWSVHMFMLFSLHRPDVLPVGDLGVRKGFQKLYQLKSLPSPAEMEKLSSRWQPYRSIGSWYMWRVLNMTLPF
ncbi:hypothetical protein R1sor_020076 [Riccia sorocarpa]|uniref:HhH-GPD domain-containing protein n=1 Tax=Riccia sorocarpa TaxID=122646 RepID=A0ABD3IFZ9_9MARC